MRFNRFLDETEGRNHLTFKYRNMEFHVMKHSTLTRIKFLNTALWLTAPGIGKYMSKQVLRLRASKVFNMQNHENVYSFWKTAKIEQKKIMPLCVSQKWCSNSKKMDIIYAVFSSPFPVIIFDRHQVEWL